MKYEVSNSRDKSLDFLEDPKGHINTDGFCQVIINVYIFGGFTNVSYGGSLIQCINRA